MGDYQNENFLQSAAKGNIEECRKLLAQGVEINYADREGNSGLMQAILNSQIDAVRFLISNEASLDTQNELQQTPLHLACDKCNKEIILLLLTNGADPNIKNSSGQKPGEGQMEIKMFINNLIQEQKAFNTLKPAQKSKLVAIFDDIDIDGQKSLDIQNAVRFNKYIEDGINDSVAERDAKDFIKTAAICNQTRVNIDEWLFSFSKLLVCDQAAFDKFIEDYDKTVEKKQKLKFQDT